MTEESGICPMNLIEYEEFVQTEHSSTSIDPHEFVNEQHLQFMNSQPTQSISDQPHHQFPQKNEDHDDRLQLLSNKLLQQQQQQQKNLKHSQAQQHAHILFTSNKRDLAIDVDETHVTPSSLSQINHPQEQQLQHPLQHPQQQLNHSQQQKNHQQQQRSNRVKQSNQQPNQQQAIDGGKLIPFFDQLHTPRNSESDASKSVIESSTPQENNNNNNNMLHQQQQGAGKKRIEQREEIYEEKINHLQKIIHTQREQITKKEEKIIFLLTQIADLNTIIATKSSEASSIRIEFAQIQQQMEQLKQQQRIKEEIQNGDSQILEIKIQQEESIIQNLDNKLLLSHSSNFPKAEIEVNEQQQQQQQPLQQTQQDQEITTSPNRLIKKQPTPPPRQQQLQQHQIQSQTSPTQLAAPNSSNVNHNRKQIADLLNYKKVPAIISISGLASSTTNQEQHSQPSLLAQSENLNNPLEQQQQQQLPNQYFKANNNNNNNTFATSVSPIPQNQSTAPVTHVKNTLSSDYVYQKDLYYPSNSTKFDSIKPVSDRSETSNELNSNLVSHYQSHSNNNTIKRSTSNHVGLSASTTPSRSQYRHNDLATLENPSSTLQLTSNYQTKKIPHISPHPLLMTSTTTSTASMITPTLATHNLTNLSNNHLPNNTSSTLRQNQDLTSKTESYRDQYIKNIEELQQRLEYLKQKRVENETKIDTHGDPSSESQQQQQQQQQQQYKEKSQNRSLHQVTSTKSTSNLRSSHQFANMKTQSHRTGISYNSTLINTSGSANGYPIKSNDHSRSVSPNFNENTHLHFAHMKRIENSATHTALAAASASHHRDSYFSKHMFSSNSFNSIGATPTLNSNTTPNQFNPFNQPIFTLGGQTATTDESMPSKLHQQQQQSSSLIQLNRPNPYLYDNYISAGSGSSAFLTRELTAQRKKHIFPMNPAITSTTTTTIPTPSSIIPKKSSIQQQSYSKTPTSSYMSSETALLSTKQLASKQYFPTTTKNNNNKIRSHDNQPLYETISYSTQDNKDSHLNTSPMKVHPTRNCDLKQFYSSEQADSFPHSTSLKKDIALHKMSWDDIAQPQRDQTNDGNGTTTLAQHLQQQHQQQSKLLTNSNNYISQSLAGKLPAAKRTSTFSISPRSPPESSLNSSLKQARLFQTNLKNSVTAN